MVSLTVFNLQVYLLQKVITIFCCALVLKIILSLNWRNIFKVLKCITKFEQLNLGKLRLGMQLNYQCLMLYSFSEHFKQKLTSDSEFICQEKSREFIFRVHFFFLKFSLAFCSWWLTFSNRKLCTTHLKLGYNCTGNYFTDVLC